VALHDLCMMLNSSCHVCQLYLGLNRVKPALKVDGFDIKSCNCSLRFSVSEKAKNGFTKRTDVEGFVFVRRK
jgi:hypothetical protein